jgi:hypothetical protein
MGATRTVTNLRAHKGLHSGPSGCTAHRRKKRHEYPILNCTGVILTSNHKTRWNFLPPDDRRHYVAWSPLGGSPLTPDEWTELWGWYERGGFGDVAAYLRELDISSFNPTEPPVKTAAFWEIADVNRAPEDAELADVIWDGEPASFTLRKLIVAAGGSEINEWLRDRKNRRVIPHRLEQCGYSPMRNDTTEKGLWIVGGTRQVIYALASLSIRDRIKAASKLIRVLKALKALKIHLH